MKKQITIETTPNQEMVIGLLLTGQLTRATTAMIAEYFEPFIEKEQKHLDERARSILTSIGVGPVEVEGLGG